MMHNDSAKRPSHKSVFLIVTTLVLLLAGSLLFYADQDEVTVAIPVRLSHVPEDLIVARDTPIVLEVRLKGPSRVVRGVEAPGLCCEVDLSPAEPGPLFVKISPEMIRVPPQVSILETDPASFTITIDQRMDKVVPVVPDLNKDPAPGYLIPRVVATPSTVQLTGPMSVLEKMSAVRTTPVDVGGLTETVKKKVALNLNHDPHVRAVGEGLVEIEIVVEQKTAEKWLDMAVRPSGGKHQCVITPDRIAVLLKGPVYTLEKVGGGNCVDVYVDLADLKPGTYVRRAVIKPPLDTTVLKAKPEVFTVKVLKAR